jgi:putative transposase
VALDPGVRTFQTFFSTETYGKIGEHDFGRIYRLCFHLDELISRVTKVGKQKKRRMLRAASRMRKNIKNLVAEIHKKTAHFLTRHYKCILLPKFETSQMVSNLRSKTVRAMLTWSHYAFKVRLKNKALERDCVVVDVCEAYTSKTMPDGSLKALGGAEKFKWNGQWIDRDINGARNILLRALVDSPDLFEVVVNEC